MTRVHPVARQSPLKVVLAWCSIAILLAASPVAAQAILLAQGPNRADAILSDAKLQSLVMWPSPTGVCTAENFVLGAASTIARLRIWGIYFPGGTAPALDHFGVAIRADAGGAPGALLWSQENVPSTRQATGRSVTGVAEYVYTLTPDAFTRTAGTYWVEVCNDTSGHGASFYWEFGTLDPTHGIPGAAAIRTTSRDLGWQAVTGDVERQDLAIEIAADPSTAAVPTLGGWVLALLGVALAATGLRFVRHSQAG